jgi:hypothetical protein
MSSAGVARNCGGSPGLLLLLAAVPAALPVFAGTIQVQVSYSAGKTMDVVAPATGKIVQASKGIEVPHMGNFSPGGKRFHIRNEAEAVLC